MNRFSIARAHSRATARVLIAAAVLVGCVLADCAVLAYELGRQTGAAVHARNDQLAALARRLATGERTPAPVPVAPQAVPAPAPVVTVAAEPAPARPTPNYERVVTAWMAVDAGSETVISEHETEEQARAACRSYRQSHPGRCPRLQERIEWRLVPATAPDPATLTVRELRALTGARSKRLRKADLVAMARGMAAAA